MINTINTPIGILNINADGYGVIPILTGKVREVYWCLEPNDVKKLAWACFLAYW